MTLSDKRDSLKGIFWGVVFILAMSLFLYGILGDPLSEYRIMSQGVHTTAKVTECVQDYAESDSGQGGVFEDCKFTYEVNGKTYHGRAVEPLPVEEIEIIYLPEDPSTYREAQGSATGFFDWLFRKAILWFVLLAMFIAGGVKMVYSSFKELFGKGS